MDKKNFINRFKADYFSSPEDLRKAFDSVVTTLGLEIIAVTFGIRGMLVIPAIILTNVLPYANRLYREGKKIKTNKSL